MAVTPQPLARFGQDPDSFGLVPEEPRKRAAVGVFSSVETLNVRGKLEPLSVGAQPPTFRSMEPLCAVHSAVPTCNDVATLAVAKPTHRNQ